MGFLHNFFKTAGEVAALTQQCDFYQHELERVRWENEQLRAEVKSERQKKDRIVNKFCDQISKQQGLPTLFKEKEVTPQAEPEFNYADEEAIRFTAESARNDDIERLRAEGKEGIEFPPSIETYIDAIRQDPDKFLRWRQQ